MKSASAILLPIVVGRKVLSQSDEKGGQPFGVSQFAVAQLDQRLAEGLLKELICGVLIPGPAPQQEAQATAVELHQLRFGSSISGFNAPSYLTRFDPVLLVLMIRQINEVQSAIRVVESKLGLDCLKFRSALKDDSTLVDALFDGKVV